MTRLTLSLIAVVILAPPLVADIIDVSGPQAGMIDWCGANPALRPSQLMPAAIENWLTFKAHVDDKDKDGFLEGADRGVNPTGYVVFHFRTVWLNERITLGEGGAGLLDVPMMLSGGGAPPGSEPAVAGGNALPDPSPPPLPPSPPRPAPVPEPATVLLLAAGMTLLTLKRRRR
ncbi:MAG TPA: PEP-CTERM sorting domain-containing protein [Phycisphaerae bacterium]|nr:PEP-CTERM sorting domain-containing protein [Phycisphaerae bacterium]